MENWTQLHTGLRPKNDAVQFVITIGHGCISAKIDVCCAISTESWTRLHTDLRPKDDVVLFVLRIGHACTLKCVLYTILSC